MSTGFLSDPNPNSMHLEGQIPSSKASVSESGLNPPKNGSNPRALEHHHPSKEKQAQVWRRKKNETQIFPRKFGGHGSYHAKSKGPTENPQGWPIQPPTRQKSWPQMKDSNKQPACLLGWLFLLPIGSMYGIFTYIFHKNQPNVGKYTIHGSYGLGMALGDFHDISYCLASFFQRDDVKENPPRVDNPMGARRGPQ